MDKNCKDDKGDKTKPAKKAMVKSKMPMSEAMPMPLRKMKTKSGAARMQK